MYKPLYKRMMKVSNYDFMKRVGIYRAIWGKKRIDHIKIVVVDHWPREGTKSDEFCTKADALLPDIEWFAEQLNKALRGKL